MDKSRKTGEKNVKDDSGIRQRAPGAEMSSPEGRKPCRRCLDDQNSIEKFNKTIEEYIGSLDAAQKVGEDRYKERLAFCEVCEKRVGVTCSLCGCFVAVRAVRATMHCPDTQGRKW